MLNGMWKSNSALPLERSVLVQNAAGQFVATQPVDSLDFPFTKAQLPDSFMSPAWSHVQDPTSNSKTPIDSVVIFCFRSPRALYMMTCAVCCNEKADVC